MTRPSSENVACVTITLAKPGCEAQLFEALQKLVADVRRQKGFIRYDLHRDMEEPRRFFAVENWGTKADFDAHASAPEVEAYRRAAAPFTEETSFHPMKLV